MDPKRLAPGNPKIFQGGKNWCFFCFRFLQKNLPFKGKLVNMCFFVLGISSQTSQFWNRTLDLLRYYGWNKIHIFPKWWFIIMVETTSIYIYINISISVQICLLDGNDIKSCSSITCHKENTQTKCPQKEETQTSGWKRNMSTNNTTTHLPPQKKIQFWYPPFAVDSDFPKRNDPTTTRVLNRTGFFEHQGTPVVSWTMTCLQMVSRLKRVIHGPFGFFFWGGGLGTETVRDSGRCGVYLFSPVRFLNRKLGEL